jgi:RND family efflux transporter MFP subunit
MKTKVLQVLALFMLVACGGNKEAKLEALKKQQDKIAMQIQQLEDEIAASADTVLQEKSGTFVSVMDVTFSPFKHYIEVQGKLDGDDNVAVYPEAMGNIVAVYAKTGQHVTAGQVLARISDATYVEQLKSLESTYKLALETYQKQENLWKQNIGSEIQYLQAKSNKETLEAQISTVKEQIDMTRIKSPITGDVEESLIKVGQAVSPNFPAFRVVNFNNLKVVADVAEAYTSKIGTGDDVIIYFPDIKQEIEAKVTFCSKFINVTNRTFSVEAQIKGKTNNLKANMISVMKINDYHAEKAVVLPINLIRSDNKGKYVLLASEENNQFVARKQAVEVGQIYNGQAEIVSGLQEGQKIISGGYLALNDGEVIRF